MVCYGAVFEDLLLLMKISKDIKNMLRKYKKIQKYINKMSYISKKHFILSSIKFYKFKKW